jgi:carbonyl reductase 1
MSYSRISVVTGANKGIGLAIGMCSNFFYGILFSSFTRPLVRNLALQYPSSTFNNGPLLIYLTARNTSRGEAAVKALYSDDQLIKAKALRKDGGLTDIRYHDLDISEPNSIKVFGEFLVKEHPDGIDVVVNNAGVAMNGFGKALIPC